MDQDPLFVAGNEIGCLLVHGFGGTPADLRPLADQLVTRGYSVSLPLLPGHGHNNVDLGTAVWQAWASALHQEAVALRRHCRVLVLVGFSMGGALSLIEMSRDPADLLVLLAPALGLGRRWTVRLQLPLLRVVKHLRPWFYPLAQADFDDPQVRVQLSLNAPPGTDFTDPAVQAFIRREVRLPVSAIDQLYRLGQRANRLGAEVTQPVLVMHGCYDRTIAPRYSLELYARLGSIDKLLRWWDSDHELVRGPQGAAVVAEIIAWLERHLSAGPAVDGAANTGVDGSAGRGVTGATVAPAVHPGSGGS